MTCSMARSRSSTVTSKACGSDLDPQFGSDPHVPLLRMLPEPEANSVLPGGMVVFPQGPFLDLPIHLLGAGLVAGAQANLNGNTSRGRHGDLQFTALSAASRRFT